MVALAQAPIRGLVRPVKMRPSFSSMATAGAPVSFSRSSAGATTARSPGFTPAFCISSSSLRTAEATGLPWASFLVAS